MFILISLGLTAAQCGGTTSDPIIKPAPAEKIEIDAETSIDAEMIAKNKPDEETAKVKPVPAQKNLSTETKMPAENGIEENPEKNKHEVETSVEANGTKEPNDIDAELGVANDNQFGKVVVSDMMDVSTPRDKHGGEYRLARLTDAVNFHPYIAYDGPSRRYQDLVYSGKLIRFDEDTLEYEPYITEKYEISDDGLTFTFYLRPGLEWSDGMPLTAYDYEWTYDQVMDPEHEYIHRSTFEFIKSYKAVDEQTLQVIIHEIYAPALSSISGFITPLPKHIWENLSWNDPETNPEINHPTVVSGPYKLVEWERDQYAIFEANENYWYHGPPNITKYIVEIVSNQDIADQKFRLGEVDRATLSSEQFDKVHELDHVTVYEWPSLTSGWRYLGMNMREGYVTSDLNIRRGIAYAIDKELLADEVFDQEQRLCAMYPTTSWAHNPNVPCYEYDTEQALAEFAKSGYTLQHDKLVDETGEQLKIRFLYGPNTSPLGELLAVTIQDYLSKVGIEVTIEALEWASFLEATGAEEPTWDIFFGNWRGSTEPHTFAGIWAEENIPTRNSVAYINAELTAEFEAAGKTYNKEARKQHYGRVQEIIAEDLPYITLSHPNDDGSLALNNRIQGVEITPLGLNDHEDWYIAE